MRKRWLAAALGFVLLWQQCGSLVLASEVTEPVAIQQELDEEAEENEAQQEEIQEVELREEDSEKEETLEEKRGMNLRIQKKKCRNRKAHLLW